MIRYWMATLAERARKRREARIVARLTGPGSAGIARTVFAEARIALFDGGSANSDTGRQVTPWVAYDVHVNSGVTATVDIADPWIEVRARDGSWARWPGRPVSAGQVAYPPATADWFVS